LPLISAGGTSLVVTMFVVGMLLSFARHEAAAVTAARRAHRLGRRSRAERWLRIPVPSAYVPPKRRRPTVTEHRRPAAAPARTPAPAAARSAAVARAATARPAGSRTAGARAAGSRAAVPRTAVRGRAS